MVPPPLNTLRTVVYHDDDDDDDELLVPQTPSLSSLGSENELFDLDRTMVCKPMAVVAWTV